MKALPIVILAGGENSRFFPLNHSSHKGLISISGRSLLIRLLENCSENGFKRFILIHNTKTSSTDLKSLSQQAKSIGVDLSLLPQLQPQGMGDALLKARDNLPDQFGVCSAYHIQAGDIFSRLLDLETDIGLVVVKTASPQDYGVLKLDGDLAVGIVEKPDINKAPSNYRVQSIYKLDKSYLDILVKENQHEYSFESALDKAILKKPASFFTLDQPLVSLKYPWRLFDLVSQILNSSQSHTHPKANLAPTTVVDDTNGPVVIEDGAQVGHATKIVGPAYIGRNARVGDFSLIRGSSLESGVRVGIHADIARSLMFEDSSFHGLGFIGDSIVGSGVKIGAGFITANKRLDRKNVEVLVKNKKIDTGRNHHGTVIGQDCRIGVRVSVMPGKYIDAKSRVLPHTIISEHITED